VNKKNSTTLKTSAGGGCHRRWFLTLTCLMSRSLLLTLVAVTLPIILVILTATQSTLHPIIDCFRPIADQSQCANRNYSNKNKCQGVLNQSLTDDPSPESLSPRA
jgi:hypothetical protein